MENPYQKWVQLSYLAVSALLSFIVFSFAMKLAGVYDIESKVRNFEIIARLSAVGIGLILFWVLYRHAKTNEFMGEVATELARVTWPTPKETASATLITIVMVLVSGMILGFLDYVWTRVVQWIL